MPFAHRLHISRRFPAAPQVHEAWRGGDWPAGGGVARVVGGLVGRDSARDCASGDGQDGKHCSELTKGENRRPGTSGKWGLHQFHRGSFYLFTVSTPELATMSSGKLSGDQLSGVKRELHEDAERRKEMKNARKTKHRP